MEHLRRVPTPTPTPTLNSVPDSIAQRAEVIDPFSANADAPSYIADDNSSTFHTPPPSYRSNSSTPSRRRLVKQSNASPSYSRPPTSCSRGSSAYAGELGHRRRGANSPLKSSTINAPTSGAKPAHRRRTSSLSSLDSVISSAGQSISKFVRRTVKHTHNNPSEKPLPPPPTNPDHTPKQSDPIRPRRLSWVQLGSPNICLLDTLPGYFDSQNRPTPTVSHKEVANLTPGEPVGTPRDLLMWKTDEDYLRREGFLCGTAEDYAELRLRAPDDDPDYYAAPEPQRCVDELGIVYKSALTRPRDEIAMNSKKKKELRKLALSATPSPTTPRRSVTG